MRHAFSPKKTRNTVERVASFKLLGVYVASDLKWGQHIDTITSKVASRLYFLKQLKRSGASQRDLLCFYTTIIRPVLEYACPVWHSSLTAAQSRALESIQRRAMRIIYADDDDYTLLLIFAGLDTLESRRAQLTERFYKRSVLPESSCLHCLLPDRRDASVTSRLRHARTFEPLITRTVKYRNSFIPYCLSNFDKCACVPGHIFSAFRVSCIVYNWIIVLPVIIQPLAAI